MSGRVPAKESNVTDCLPFSLGEAAGERTIISGKSAEKVHLKHTYLTVLVYRHAQLRESRQ